jgi:hypothetical protein
MIEQTGENQLTQTTEVNLLVYDHQKVTNQRIITVTDVEGPVRKNCNLVYHYNKIVKLLNSDTILLNPDKKLKEIPYNCCLAFPFDLIIWLVRKYTGCYFKIIKKFPIVNLLVLSCPWVNPCLLFPLIVAISGIIPFINIFFFTLLSCILDLQFEVFYCT